MNAVTARTETIAAAIENGWIVRNNGFANTEFRKGELKIAVRYNKNGAVSRSVVYAEVDGIHTREAIAANQRQMLLDIFNDRF